MNNIRALFKQTCCLCPQAVPVFCAADSGKKQAPRTSKKAERKREKKSTQDTASAEVSEASDEMPRKCKEAKSGLQKGGHPGFRLH